MKRKLLLAFCFFVLLLLSSCGDDVVIMPASQCQVTCTDDATGKEYGIAMRAIVWNDEDDDYNAGSDYGCRVYVDAYRGELNEAGDFITEGGDYMAPFFYQSYPADGDYWNEYSFSFSTSDFASDTSYPPLDDYIFYQLLDESTIQIYETESSIAAQYDHRINPCIMNAQIEITATCNTESDHLQIECYRSDEDDNLYRESEDDNDIRCPSGEGDSCLEDINQDDIGEYHSDIQAAMDALE